jgi:AmiR/NasT family two-component response regulator
MMDLKILIADDLALIRSLIRKSLADLKLTNVEEAVDGIDAINKIIECNKRGVPYDVFQPSLLISKLERISTKRAG